MKTWFELTSRPIGRVPSLSERTHRENVRYQRGSLAKLIDDLGDDGVRGKIRSLTDELRSDGFDLAAEQAAQAGALLSEVEAILERAKAEVQS